jgi:hypothetical protein
MANHDMVKYVYIKQFAGLYDLARDEHILNIYMENHLTV